MNLSPVEAINRVNETVTVEMLVRRTKRCSTAARISSAVVGMAFSRLLSARLPIGVILGEGPTQA